MTLLDRYILRRLAINYVLALAIMMSLYIVLDLFFNMDEFTEHGQPVFDVLWTIAGYYGINMFLYFAQLSGAITLFACMITLARLRKLNELTAMLASGVSLYRVAAPVLGFGVLTTALWYVDVEIIVPSLAPQLSRPHDDAAGTGTYGVWFLNDHDNALLSARQFLPHSGELRHMLVLERDSRGHIAGVIEADRAVWEARPGHPAGGLWALEGGRHWTPTASSGTRFGPEQRMGEESIRYYESTLTPGDIEARQSTQWTKLLSSAQLLDLLHRGHVDAEVLQQAMHARFAGPLVNILMLLLGIPIILSRDPSTVSNDSARCLALAGACFLAAFVGQSQVWSGPLSALPAWIPLIIFTPVAVVLFDRLKT